MARRYLPPGLLITILLVATIVATRSGAISLFSPDDLTPTAIPPLATQAAQTEQAFQLTFAAAPTTDIQQEYPIFNNAPLSPDEILAGKPEGALAGYGIMYENDPSTDFDQKYRFNGRSWREETGDSAIWVTGGRAIESPNQGAIRVTIANDRHNNDLIIQTPIQAGELTITGAVGERLILTSEQGQTFYFDVPSLRFVGNLEDNVPTATPLPTEVYEPPLVSTDDAIDEPLYLDDFQLEDTNIDRYISSPTDYDWFAFVSQAEGILKVSLVPRGNNYGLRVVHVDQDGNGTIVGEDTSSGGGTKQVTMDNAPSGNYLVRVWSLDGSFDESQPYILRFNPPKPEKVIPILECIAENPDGTFTAHFGYENPNPYVVVIDSRHQNTFHPGPTFRTGQPEYFAPGRVEDWFSVLFDGNGLTWVLDGGAVTANRNSPRCP
jgi:hypothetical protein